MARKVRIRYPDLHDIEGQKAMRACAVSNARTARRLGLSRAVPVVYAAHEQDWLRAYDDRVQTREDIHARATGRSARREATKPEHGPTEGAGQGRQGLCVEPEATGQ